MSNSAFGVYLFGLVSTVEGRYKVFSVRTEPSLPLLRFRILLAERLGVAHPETLTVWRLNEDLGNDDKRLLQGDEDPATLFDVTELPETFASLASWIENLEENTLHVVVRVPAGAGAPAGEMVANLETVDALPPAYSYASTAPDAPYWGSRNAVTAKSPMIGLEGQYSGALMPPPPQAAVAPFHAAAQGSVAPSSAGTTLVEHVSSTAASAKAGGIEELAMGKAEHNLTGSRRRRRRRHLLMALAAAIILLLAIVAIVVGVVVSQNASSSSSSSSSSASGPASPSSSPSLTPFINPSNPNPKPVTARNSTWVALYGYDWSYGNDLTHFVLPPDKNHQCGTTCASTPNCVGGVWTSWEGGMCYLKTVMVNPIINTLCTAYFETNTSYTAWPKQIGQGVLASAAADIAKYNATELECGSLCADFANCRGFEINPNPNATDAGCTLKALTSPLTEKQNVTFWLKP
ncbi:hypothetical protein HDU86_001923 [Geranomyces michiganensis]|nr:hypothetical protein HDU86_001923 [Geranomyces michiganensis]